MSKIELLPTQALSAPRARELRAWLISAFDGDFSDEDWRHTPPIDVAGEITADWRSGDVW